MAEDKGGGAQAGRFDGPTEYRPPAVPWIHRLQFRLAALVFLAVLPMAALLLRENLSAREAAIQSAGREAALASGIAAANQAEALQRPQSILETVAREPAVREGDAAACGTLFADLLARNPDFRDFHLVAPDGSVIASALPAAESAALSDRASVERTMKTGRTEIGAFRAEGKEGVTVYVTCPAGPEGAPPRAVLGGTVSLTWLARFQRICRLPGDSILQVLDPDGATLLRVSDTGMATGAGKHPALAAIREIPLGETRPVVAAEADGIRRFYGMAPLTTGGSRQGFLIVVGIPEERFVGNVDRTLRIALIVTAAALLLTLGVAKVLGDRLIVRRVNGLILATRRLASTDLGKLKARSRVCQDPSELGDLERSFDDMARALEKHVKEMK